MDFILNDGSQEPLKKVLLNEYGSPDKRIKRLEKMTFFIVDDRTEGDRGADGQLFHWFCTILAEPVMGGGLKVTLGRSVPMGPSVEAWIKEHKASYASDLSPRLEFLIEKGQQAKLQSLAAAFRDIVKRPYPIPSYKYVCPRTADSLESIRKVLDKAWSGPGKA
jgi:hypothetical protein